MKLLREIVSTPQERYNKAKTLHDHPNTGPGEKSAAKAAMDRIAKEHGIDQSSSTYKGTETPRTVKTNHPYGYYAYSPIKKKYWGPYSHESHADSLARHGGEHYSYRTVYNSPHTGWRERTKGFAGKDGNYIHDIDSSASFPHLDKKKDRSHSRYDESFGDREAFFDFLEQYEFKNDK